MTTYQKPICIPAPDLLDLVKLHLPGESGISAIYSILGGLNFRIARLAGMTAAGLASDSRKESQGVDSWNDAMSHLEALDAAAASFRDAGFERTSMTDGLTELLSYKHTVVDYAATLLGESKVPQVIWADTVTMAGEPMPVDKWKLDYEWESYIASGKPLMTRPEYDMLSIRELGGQRAAWAKHINTVCNFIEVADNGQPIEFFQLSLKTQFSLLASYATPERMMKFRASIMKRSRTRFEADTSIRLTQAFVASCELATSHPRYMTLSEPLKAAVEPLIASTSETIAAANFARIKLGIHAESIKESLDAQKELAHHRKAEAIINLQLAAEHDGHTVAIPPKVKVTIGPVHDKDRNVIELVDMPNDL